MEFEVYNTRINLDDDIQKISIIRNEYSELVKNLLNEVRDKLEKHNAEDAISVVIEAYTSQCEKIITDISEYGIYDKIPDDFIGGNPTFATFLDSIGDYINKLTSIQQKASREASLQLDRAAQNAQNSIHGLDFGIVSNDIVSLWIYDSFNQSALDKSVSQAKRDLYSQSVSINNAARAQVQNETHQYIDEQFKDGFIEIVGELFSNLFKEHAEVLVEHGVIKASVFHLIDEKRSNAILKNLKMVENREKIILTALELCPYNANVYIEAYREYEFEMAMCDMIKWLKIKDTFCAYIYSTCNVDYILPMTFYKRNVKIIKELDFTLTTTTAYQQLFSLYCEHVKRKFIEIKKYIDNGTIKDREKFNEIIDEYGGTKEFVSRILGDEEKLVQIKEFSDINLLDIIFEIWENQMGETYDDFVSLIDKIYIENHDAIINAKNEIKKPQKPELPLFWKIYLLSIPCLGLLLGVFFSDLDLVSTLRIIIEYTLKADAIPLVLILLAFGPEWRDYKVAQKKYIEYESKKISESKAKNRVIELISRQQKAIAMVIFVIIVLFLLFT